MRAVPYDFEKIELKKSYFKRSNNQKIIEEFLASGQDCVKIEDWTQKSAMCCAGVLNKSIERFKLTGAKAISRNGEVYLIKASLFK